HLPQRVHASSMASTRAVSPASNVSSMALLPANELVGKVYGRAPVRRPLWLADQPATATAWISIMIAGSANPAAVMAALAGKSVPKI
ncbi:MAG TPA: hypothetical protein VLN57_13530, partial [Xanthobacteraceae bacterium]|nr:hypothetical protein [Xanthobacteraceae bacterium]